MENKIEIGRVIIQKYLLEDFINIMFASNYCLEITKINEQECFIVIFKNEEEK